MSSVAQEPVVAGQGKKYIRFVSDENLRCAGGGKFIGKECAVGERNVYIEGCWPWWVVSTPHGALNPRGRARGPLRGQQGQAFPVTIGETEASSRVTCLKPLDNPRTRT